MHDIGTSRPGGWGPGYNEFEQELSSELTGEFSQELGGEYEFETGFETAFETGEAEFESEFETAVSGEMQEMELAAELLAANNEQEMEQFLGGLVKSIGRAASGFANSSVGKALGGMLKSAVKSALPVVGGALGNLVVPGVGGAIGSKLAGMAGSALGLELEGLSNEDREFEVARRVVRIGQQAARHLATIPPHVPPARAARVAFLRAAQQVAPGLVPAMRVLAQQGPAALRASAAPIFGAPAASAHALAPTHPGAHPGARTNGHAAGYAGPSASDGGAVANCPSCGTALPHLTHHIPRTGVWRRSRSGRAIVLYLAAPAKPAF
jgi:hypothetical protein